MPHGSACWSFVTTAVPGSKSNSKAMSKKPGPASPSISTIMGTHLSRLKWVNGLLASDARMLDLGGTRTDPDEDQHRIALSLEQRQEMSDYTGGAAVSGTNTEDTSTRPKRKRPLRGGLDR